MSKLVQQLYLEDFDDIEKKPISLTEHDPETETSKNLILYESDTIEKRGKKLLFYYDKSVSKVENLKITRYSLTVDILKELATARMLLSAQGARNDLTKFLDKLEVDGVQIIGEHKRGFTNYLKKVGLHPETVRLWLNDYDASNNVYNRFPIPPRKEKVKSQKQSQLKNPEVYVIPQCPNCGTKLEYNQVFNEAVNRTADTKVKELLKKKKK